MITQTVEVRSQNIIIGVVSYPVYETLGEATDALPNSLEILNRDVKAQAMSRARKRLTSKAKNK